MKKIILFLILISICNVANAEIKKQIEFDTTLKFREWADPPWLFTGTFDFEELPKPLKPTKVDFSLEAVQSNKSETNPSTWQIRVDYLNNAVKILGDTIFYWPPPHKPGDIFKGTIEFIPLMSGLHAIGLDEVNNFKRWVSFEKGISFQWVIDRRGKLHQLDQFGAKINEHIMHNTYFFNKDSVHIYQSPDLGKNNIFEYEITIKPTPRIGNTSAIKYSLKANKLVYEAFEMALGIDGMDIPKEPEKIEYSITSGQTINPVLHFVPDNVSDKHSIDLNIYDRSVPKKHQKPRRDRQRIYIAFIFDEDGNLKYVYDHNMASPPDTEIKRDPSKKYWNVRSKVIVIKPGN